VGKKRRDDERDERRGKDTEHGDLLTKARIGRTEALVRF
jgi:hypothetical protein